jgi:Protein of unknown function (DUF4197)
MTTRSITLMGLLGCLVLGSAFASGLGDLTNQDASRGIKGALAEGVSSAIVRLGVPMGRGKDADELVVAMNRAAEEAVPEAKVLMLNAIKTMSIKDAKQILTGGDGSVTRFFKAKTAAPLAEKFLPIVKKATDRVGLARKYNQFAGAGARLGLVKGNAVNIETYVTQKALDGLYREIGDGKLGHWRVEIWLIDHWWSSLKR